MRERKKDQPESATQRFEWMVAGAKERQYVLRLYVAGSTSRSLRAIENLKQICEEHLPGQYELEVIDVYQCPTLSKGAQIVALPTLVKQLPPPFRRLVGDLSDREQVLVSLDLIPQD